MIKTRTLVTGLTVAFLGATVGCTTTPYHSNGKVYHPDHSKVYKSGKHDPNKHKGKKNKSVHKNANSAAAEKMAARTLTAMGYRVEKVDYKEKQGIVKSTAYRGGSKYKIDLSYPGMDVVKLKKN